MEKLTQTDLNRIDAVLSEVRRECVRAAEQHGRERTPLDPVMPEMGKVIILGEEFGEICRTLTYDQPSGMIPVNSRREELVQLAAMAVMWRAAL